MAGITNANYSFMKLGRQWLSMIWASVTLLCPDIRPDSDDLRSESTAQWTQSHAYGACGDALVQADANSEKKSCDHDVAEASLLPSPPFSFTEPFWMFCGTTAEFAGRNEFSTAIRLPASRGPPAQT